MLILLRNRLTLVVEDTPIVSSHDSDESDSDDMDEEIDSRPTPAVIRIAAHAAILFTDKYLDMMWHRDIYIISIGM